MTVLFVVSGILVFLGLDWAVARRQRHAAPAPHAAPAVVRLPRGVYFARSHTWLNLFPSGRAWLGVDDFVVRLLARPRVELLVAPGSRVGRGDPLLALCEGERRLTVRSPLAARVAAANPDRAGAAWSPERTPFFSGWLVELEPERAADVKALLLGEETAGWLEGELGRLRDLLAAGPPGLTPAALSDGGAPVAGALAQAGPELWERFEREFLEVR
jgi:glycine cleavage system H lipoate-binding protein